MLGNETVFKDVQFLNIELPQFETEEGMVIEVSREQDSKAEGLIVVTEEGMVTAVIFEPFTKLEGRYCTLLPIVTLVIFEVVIPPLVVRLMAFQVSCVMLLQPLKALEPILVKFSGIVSEVMPLQFWKA